MNSNPTLLVVEDNHSLREAICEFVQFVRPTWRAITAINGQKGVELAEAIHPDMILTDLNMPVMDGHEMAVTLQRLPETQSIPLILCTSEDISSPRVARLRPLYRAIVEKPNLFNQLEGLLDRTYQCPCKTS